MADPKLNLDVEGSQLQDLLIRILAHLQELVERHGIRTNESENLLHEAELQLLVVDRVAFVEYCGLLAASPLQVLRTKSADLLLRLAEVSPFSQQILETLAADDEAVVRANLGRSLRAATVECLPPGLNSLVLLRIIDFR